MKSSLTDAERVKENHHSLICSGYALVFLGIALFLKNFEWLDFSWNTFWRCWPLLLVFGGIAVIPMKKWLKHILAILCVIGAMFVLWNISDPDGYSLSACQTEQQECDTIAHTDGCAVVCVENDPVESSRPVEKTPRPVVETPRPIPRKDSSLILDVTLLNLTDGLVDRSIYQHPQIGGTTGVEAYSEGGVRLLARRRGANIFPKWRINKVMLPMTIEYEVKRFDGVPGHGDCMFFFEFDQQSNTHFINQSITAWRDNRFAPARSVMFPSPWQDFSPTVQANQWVKVRVEYSAPIAGTGIVKTYFNDVLQNTIYISENYVAKHCESFALASEWLSAHDAANAVFRNLKIWLP